METPKPHPKVRLMTADASPAMDRMVAPKPRWRRYAPWAAGAVVLAALAGWVLTTTGGNVIRIPANRLTISTVTRGPFEDYIAVRATVTPYTTAYLTTEQGGTVKQVLVEDGAQVKSGQPLVILSNPALQLQVAAQQLQFEDTRVKYQRDMLDIENRIAKLKSDLERDKILLDGQAIAPRVFEQEQQDYAYNLRLRDALTASYNLQQKIRTSQITGQAAGSQVSLADAGIDALTIRAPMDGQLTALDAEVGQSKAQGAVLGQVNSADRFKLTAQVDEFYLGRVVLGQEALFTADGKSWRAKVSKVYPQVINGTFKVDMYFQGAAPPGVHVGQALDLKLELGGAAAAVMLPNGPFYQDTGGNWVFVLNANGAGALKRNVRLGRRNPDYVEVIDGLKPGEKVITSGYESYLKMDRVELRAPDNNP